VLVLFSAPPISGEAIASFARLKIWRVHSSWRGETDKPAALSLSLSLFLSLSVCVFPALFARFFLPD